MLSVRYLIRLISAFFLRFRGIILLAAIFGIVIFLLFRLVGSNLLSRSTERIGLVGRYRIETLPTDVLGLISSGLTKVNPDGTISPGLAASWETSDGGQTWTFMLRGGINWQDGRKVTSQSIHYEFSDARIERP
ncbi:MAG: ABC transporter substrate-binding protein, partial [Patescibacteria group bacterium]